MAGLTLQPFTKGNLLGSWVSGKLLMGGRHSAAQKRNAAPQTTGQCRGR